MDWQSVMLIDPARVRATTTSGPSGLDQAGRAVSDYDLAVATVFPPLGANGDWRQRLSRVLDRRLQGGAGVG